MKRIHFWSKFRRNRRVLYSLVIILFTLGIGLRHVKIEIKRPKAFDTIVVVPYKVQRSKSHFVYDWSRIHRARTDWQAMLKLCSDQMAWGSLKSGWGKVNRTSARRSYVIYKDIQPSGHFSRIFIQTRTAGGQEKTIGGDFWRVFLTGPANVAASVFDHENGTYEAIALLLEPGNYSVLAYLDYTLCDGLRDPPENWFRIGNAQGKYQAKGSLGFLDEYLYEPFLGGRSMTVQIVPSSLVPNLQNIKCKRTCRSLWDGHGRWKADRWRPYLTDNFEQGMETPRFRDGTLWIFGDSIGCRLYRSLAKKPLCNQTFVACRCSYNWIYPVPNNNITLGRLLNDDFDFRADIVLKSLRSVLHHNAMKSSRSLLLLNFGLHYPISVNFTTFQKLIDDVIIMLKDRDRELGPRVIWKTTTAMHKENAEPPRNVTHFRFASEQRVRLFDSYAMWAMCNADIEILDVFPLSASYPRGTVDITHYHEETFLAAENELKRYVLSEVKEKTRRVCVG